MDRYLIKTKREKKKKDVCHIQGLSSLKQSTIYSLKRVVVLEDIQRLKSKLMLQNQSKAVIMESLIELGKKIPSLEIMQSTKIGHIIKRLKQNSDADIVREARRLYVKWKSFFLEGMKKMPIEVRCDKKTETLRMKGRALLSESLGSESHKDLADAIERETFHQHKQLASPSYRRTLRTIILKLKHESDLRQSLLSAHISVETLVADYKKK